MITLQHPSKSLMYPLLLALLAFALPIQAQARSTLEDIRFADLSGDEVEIDLLFSGAPPEASDFSTDNPARIAIDLPNTVSRLDWRERSIGLGFAHSLTTIQASGRTRVVINLNRAVPYEIRQGEQSLTVVINPAPPAVVNEEPSAAEQERLAREEAVIGERDEIGAIRTTRFRPPSTGTRSVLSDIDFRRGIDGTGRVKIRLPSAQTAVTVSRRAGDVLVNIPNTQLPQRLFRRLDVVDFGTPVSTIESRPEGEDIQIKVQTTEGDYDYLAYQTDNLYTLEFRSLTPAEREQLERERVVFEGDRLTLNFQDIEVRAVLQLLADFTDMNLVTSDSVRGNITLRLRNVPWDQALDIVLKTKDLGMRRTGNVMMIAPAQEIHDREQRELLATQTREELAPLRSEFMQVNYAKATDFAEILKSDDNRLLSERGQITVDPRTNTLLVRDTSAHLEEIRRLVMRLDIPVRQVMIESRVVIADNNFARDLGVRFGATGSMGRLGDHELLIAGGQPGHLPGTGSVDKGPFSGVYDPRFYQQPGLGAPNNQIPVSRYNSSLGGGAENLLVSLPVTEPAGAINFLLGKVGSHLIQLELSAMQREGRGEIVSAPRVVTSDQQQATISLGERIPYTTRDGDGDPTVEFIEALLKLDVTPHITPDEQIIMQLKVNKDEPNWAQRSAIGNPAINTREVETSALVDNGETVVLGGVFEGLRASSQEKVPWLGDLPVFGNLFRRQTHREENSELLIFVTPRILQRDDGRGG